jgi:hypothetical protein
LFGEPLPERGLLKINRNPESTNPENVIPTLTHEMTHATHRQLDRQYAELYYKKNKTDIEKQFMNNYEKIIGFKEPAISNQIQQMAPDFAKNKSNYRATGREAMAFGLENSVFPENIFASNAPSHVDPTMATQLMLLLEQAQRVQDQQPASQGR